MLINYKFLIKTNGNNDIIDLTDKVKNVIKLKKISTAQISIFTPASNTSVFIMEYDPGIVKDFSNFINEIVPNKTNYRHNIEWMDNLGSGFIKSAIIGSFVTVPFINGEFEMDRFQRILFVDFSFQSSSRSVIIQMIY